MSVVHVTIDRMGWIGLPRAQREWAALSAKRREEIGPPIAPARVVAVLSLPADGRPGDRAKWWRSCADLGRYPRPEADASSPTGASSRGRASRRVRASVAQAISSSARRTSPP